MISFPASVFDFGAHRALLVGNERAAVYHLKHNTVIHYSVFDAGEAGRQRLHRYLNGTPDIPFYVLVDLFDEEYRQDTIPRISGRDRRALLKRKAGRLFKDTSYCYYKVMGRETGARANDRVLLSSLTNPAVIRQWLAVFEETRTPVARICSLPIFTEYLLKPIVGCCDGRRLLVSLQDISGLRQTFFDNGKFQFSRLVPMPQRDPASCLHVIHDEVEKVQRYLISQRPFNPEEPLHIHFILGGDLLQDLKSARTTEEDVNYHFFDPGELLETTGSGTQTSTPLVDLYFIQRFLKIRPGNYYARIAERRYFNLWKLRASVTACTIFLLLGSAGWSGLNFLDGIVYKREGDGAKEQAQLFAAKYEQARKRHPVTPVEAPDLKAAVGIADSLAHYKSSPIDMMQLLSRSLDLFPSIRFNKLTWAAAVDPDTTFSHTTARADLREVLNVPDAGAATAMYNAVLVEGRIEPFDGNFREAMEAVRQLAADLRARETVHDVRIVSLPLDISSSADLQGNMQSQDRRAEFTLRLVLTRGET